MDIFLLIMRILFLVIASIAAIAYLLAQFFQKMPVSFFGVKTLDYVVFAIVSFIFGFGLNSYLGLLAFIPLYVFKILIKFLIFKWRRALPNGFWVEVSWKKLTPRGFERDVPRQMIEEMNKIPNSVHFFIPRLYFMLGVRYMMKNMQKNQAAGSLSQNQQVQAQQKLNELVDSFINLQPSQTKTQSLPFGIIKVTR